MLNIFYLNGPENYHHLQSSLYSLLSTWMLHADPIFLQIGFIYVLKTVTKCHKSFGQQQKGTKTLQMNISNKILKWDCEMNMTVHSTRGHVNCLLVNTHCTLLIRI